MLTLYGVLRSRASRNVWLAHELGVEFRHVPVIQAYRTPQPGQLTTASPEFRAVNPNGRVPAMDWDGVVLNESLAINLYMAKRAGGPLAPADLAEDGLMTMWSLWAMTEVEPHSINVLYHTIGKPPAERDPAVLAAAIAALAQPFQVLDEALARDGFAVGGRFTVADLNLAEVFRYAQPAPELFEATPRVRDWLLASQARPAFRRMMTERDQEPA